MRHRCSIQLAGTLVIAALLTGCVKHNRVDTLEDWQAYGDAVPVDTTVHIAALGKSQIPNLPGCRARSI